jgi:DNA-binding transcriptional regulator YdaS (Cro superfamily)
LLILGGGVIWRQCFTFMKALLYTARMELQQHLSQERGRLKSLAKTCGFTQSFLSQLALGVRPVPVQRCSCIEKATGFVVRRWDLRPKDWWVIWPELIGTDGAPPVTDVELVAQQGPDMRNDPPQSPGVGPMGAGQAADAAPVDESAVSDAVGCLHP